jgi:hypothetical protein
VHKLKASQDDNTCKTYSQEAIWDDGLFGFVQELWTIPTANMMYIKSQNHTNTVVDEHGIHTFEFVFVVF